MLQPSDWSTPPPQLQTPRLQSTCDVSSSWIVPTEVVITRGVVLSQTFRSSAPWSTMVWRPRRSLRARNTGVEREGRSSGDLASRQRAAGALAEDAPVEDVRVVLRGLVREAREGPGGDVGGIADPEEDGEGGGAHHDARKVTAEQLVWLRLSRLFFRERRTQEFLWIRLLRA